MKKKIIVVGAGFSGLTVALELSKRNFIVEIHEKSSRCGGLLGTRRTPYGLVESAANGLLRNKAVENLFSELELELLPTLPDAKKRYLFREKPRRWPLRWKENWALAGRLLFHLLTGKYFLRPHLGETIQDWGQSRLGLPTTNYVLAPALQGIYAGDSHRLSASLILKPLFNKNRSRFRGTVSTRGGMQDVIDALEKKLREAGVVFHFNSTFSFDDTDEPVILATSASVASDLLRKKAPVVSRLLSKINMTSLLTVTSFWKNPPEPYPGFGCLIPRGSGLQTLGVLMNHFIFPERSSCPSESFILGGATNPAVLDLSDSQIQDLIRQERKEIFGLSSELLDCHITRWPQALPHYDVELEKVLHLLPEMDSVFLHGNYLGSIGLSKILERSSLLADRMAKKYG
jgi:oxygen-dependent protoporphyrinogen oxidase